MAESLHLTLPDLAATAGLGRQLAAAIRELKPVQLVCYLQGELGAGKTTLVRSLLAELGHPGRVPSPTYTLLEPYELAGFRVLHMDLYRLRDPGEFDDLGVEDELGAGSLLLVEWPDRGGARLPLPDLDCRLAIAEPGRTADVLGLTPLGVGLVGEVARQSTNSTPPVGSGPGAELYRN